MRKWEDAMIEEINLAATAHGGYYNPNFDSIWHDDNDETKPIHTTSSAS